MHGLPTRKLGRANRVCTRGGWTQTLGNVPPDRKSRATRELELRRRLPRPPLRRAWRHSAGISQAAGAEHCGVSRQGFAQWEAGITEPRGDHLELYVSLLEECRELVEA